MTSWLEKHKDEIELFFLPAYSPEYNPDELLNSDIKRGVGAKFYAKTQRELEAHAYNHLRACLASRYRYKIYVQSCQEDVIIERT